MLEDKEIMIIQNEDGTFSEYDIAMTLLLAAKMKNNARKWWNY